MGKAAHFADVLDDEGSPLPKRPRRRETPTLSLFEWAIKQEQKGALAGAAR